MPFMLPRVEHGKWIKVETNIGTEIVPADLVGGDPTQAKLKDYLEGDRIQSFEVVEGYGARMSAPGYLDCTEWTVFDTYQEALDFLNETYGDNN